METLENNILIAEFMGWENVSLYKDDKLPEDWIYPKPAPEKGTEHRSVDPRVLFYHTKWDWLMKVLEKIEDEYFTRIESDGVGTYTFSCSKTWRELDDADNLGLPNGFMIRSDERACSFEDVKLEAVYRAVIHYIQWYNNK